MYEYEIKLSEQQWEILCDALESYGVGAIDAENWFANVASNLVLQDLVNQSTTKETSDE
jgi:hypothetical protein